MPKYTIVDVLVRDFAFRTFWEGAYAPGSTDGATLSHIHWYGDTQFEHALAEDLEASELPAALIQDLEAAVHRLEVARVSRMRDLHNEMRRICLAQKPRATVLVPAYPEFARSELGELGV